MQIAQKLRKEAKRVGKTLNQDEFVIQVLLEAGLTVVSFLWF
jgi:hypothetical protein